MHLLSFKSAAPQAGAVCDEIAAIDAALDDLEETPNAAAAQDLEARIKALPFDALDDQIDDPAWHDASAAMESIVNRLADLAGQPRDEKRLSALGGIWNTKRRRGLDDIIVDGFYHGLWNAGKAAWWTLKTVIKGAIAAGRLAAPHVAAGVNSAAQALGDAAVHVEAYVRGDGTKVPAHDRATPGKSMDFSDRIDDDFDRRCHDISAAISSASSIDALGAILQEIEILDQENTLRRSVTAGSEVERISVEVDGLRTSLIDKFSELDTLKSASRPLEAKAMRLITTQSYRDEARIAEKQAAGDYVVLVSPEFLFQDGTARVVLDGHHSLEAALRDGVNPILVEAGTGDAATWVKPILDASTGELIHGAAPHFEPDADEMGGADDGDGAKSTRRISRKSGNSDAAFESAFSAMLAAQNRYRDASKDDLVLPYDDDEDSENWDYSAAYYKAFSAYQESITNVRSVMYAITDPATRQEAWDRLEPALGPDLLLDPSIDWSAMEGDNAKSFRAPRAKSAGATGIVAAVEKMLADIAAFKENVQLFIDDAEDEFNYSSWDGYGTADMLEAELAHARDTLNELNAAKPQIAELLAIANTVYDKIQDVQMAAEELEADMDMAIESVTAAIPLIESATPSEDGEKSARRPRRKAARLRLKSNRDAEPMTDEESSDFADMLEALASDAENPASAVDDITNQLADLGIDSHQIPDAIGDLSRTGGIAAARQITALTRIGTALVSVHDYADAA
ncbi:MAG: hypothetical protein ABL904_17105 [Hyphomicrobiaceae bacterium]